MSPTLRIVTVDGFGALATFGPVILNIAKRVLPLERIRQSMSLTERLAREVGKVGSFTIVEPEAVSPQPEAERQEVSRMMLTSPLTAAAIVIEGSGFRAAAARTVLSGYFMIKRPYPIKVTTEPEGGAHWLSAELSRRGARVEPKWLTEALASVRAALPA